MIRASRTRGEHHPDFIFHSSTPQTTQEPIMKVFIALMALVVLASAFEEEEMEADVAFIKRDPVLQDYFMAEKRGKAMRKYKACDVQFSAEQTCYCARRTGKFAFCGGAAGGENM
ncbi:uncharacterized protein LOC121419866 [Lytechinus variegatus]|uniref:uncharacterized protein LOC121419866 n=1 Tax=Lytechinus variegatus TaxID=7654 RepID=UPI001BB1A2A9|nr:uncharacterized protein LOC121419866 [Lytechinus variegatus]